jgi:hypothetical protein
MLASSPLIFPQKNHHLVSPPDRLQTFRKEDRRPASPVDRRQILHQVDRPRVLRVDHHQVSQADLPMEVGRHQAVPKERSLFLPAG